MGIIVAYTYMNEGVCAKYGESNKRGSAEKTFDTRNCC